MPDILHLCVLCFLLTVSMALLIVTYAPSQRWGRFVNKPQVMKAAAGGAMHSPARLRMLASLRLPNCVLCGQPSKNMCSRASNIRFALWEYNLELVVSVGHGDEAGCLPSDWETSMTRLESAPFTSPTACTNVVSRAVWIPGMGGGWSAAVAGKPALFKYCERIRFQLSVARTPPWLAFSCCNSWESTGVEQHHGFWGETTEHSRFSAHPTNLDSPKM